MEGLGCITAKREKKKKQNKTTNKQTKPKNKNQTKNLVLVSGGEEKKKDDYYVWICLNKGRDGFVTLTKACYWAKMRDFIIFGFWFFF